MKAVYYHYSLWEDFHAGMYEEQKDGRSDRVQLAVKLLTSPKELYVQMSRVTKEWKIACEHWFTVNKSHRAFLGQSACCIWKGVHEDETREAWGLITEEQRITANKVADKVYSEWERSYLKNKSGYQYSIFDN